MVGKILFLYLNSLYEAKNILPKNKIYRNNPIIPVYKIVSSKTLCGLSMKPKNSYVIKSNPEYPFPKNKFSKINVKKPIQRVILPVSLLSDIPPVFASLSIRI